MTDRFPASHAEHDGLLIAALAAGDLEAAEREPAELLAAACSQCALLVADLRAIASATAALPTLERRRDFTISAEDAARLRRAGWRGLARTLAGPRSAALKPLATGLTTLGIAGLLLAALPAVQLGGAAGGPTGAAAPAASSEAATSPDVDSVFPAPGPTTAPGRLGGAYSEGSSPPRDAHPVSRPSTLDVDTAGGEDGPAVPNKDAVQPGDGARIPGPPSALTVLSGGFLVAGLLLFGIHWTVRRIAKA